MPGSCTQILKRVIIAMNISILTLIGVFKYETVLGSKIFKKLMNHRKYQQHKLNQIYRWGHHLFGKKQKRRVSPKIRIQTSKSDIKMNTMIDIMTFDTFLWFSKVLLCPRVDLKEQAQRYHQQNLPIFPKTASTRKQRSWWIVIIRFKNVASFDV